MLNGESVFGGEVVVERQIPFRIFVVADAIFFRLERYRTVFPQHEGHEPEGVDVSRVFFNKGFTVIGLFISLAGEAEEPHQVIPDSRFGRHA